MSDASTTAPPSATQTTFTVYAGPPLETIRSIVASEFQVKDAFLDPNGVPTILVANEPMKQKFKNILGQLANHRLLAAVRGQGDSLTIKIFQKPELRPSRRKINLAFFIGTLATVSLSGYILWTGAFIGPQALQSKYVQIIDPTANPFVKAAMFAAGLLAIIGLHEFGHKAAARQHKLDATLPYFIPGPPPIGTFGALISLRAPPANRDHLFDLGLSGPVVGFVVTIIVGILSMLFGVSLSQARFDQLTALFAGSNSASGWPYQPLILLSLCGVTSCANPNFVVDQQLFFAAQIGALLTFLNIIPAWQLDGGHISRAVFGSAGHRIATFIGLGILLFSGFWIFAFFVLVMMGFSRRGMSGVEPLDDVSPVSNSRKVLYLIGIVMLVLTFTYYPTF